MGIAENGKQIIQAGVLAGAVALLAVGLGECAAKNIGEVASNITGSFSGLAKLITAGSYVAGLGFAVGAVLKFKSHKDNPSQIPVGTPIAMLFIAAALIFLPSVFGSLGATVFGQGASQAGVTGVDTFQQ